MEFGRLAHQVVDGAGLVVQEEVLRVAVRSGDVIFGLNERDQAFTWLEKACENRDEDLDSIAVDPLPAPLRADRRFQALLGWMNLAAAARVAVAYRPE
jgi:hypothetical protein